jgi:hypothetical protein
MQKASSPSVSVKQYIEPKTLETNQNAFFSYAGIALRISPPAWVGKSNGLEK